MTVSHMSVSSKRGKIVQALLQITRWSYKITKANLYIVTHKVDNHLSNS